MSDDDALRRQVVLRKLYQASALCTCFIIVEVVGGMMAHSLAVLSDAAHLTSDLASFGVAIAASYLASLPPTAQHTYGLKRSESLAALFSMVSLAFISIWLAYEAIHRMLSPPEELVQGSLMSGIATIGVIVNLILAAVLGEDHVHMPGGHSHGHSHGHGTEHQHGHDHHDDCDHHDEENAGAVTSYQNGHSHDHDHGQEDHSHDHHAHASAGDHETDPMIAKTHVDEVSPAQLQEIDKRNVNLRAAYLHVLADLAQSVAVLIAGLVIWFKPEWHIIDPILTLCFAILVLYSTFGVVRSAVAVLLEETPPNLSWQVVFDAIASVPNVNNVHDLHIWCISHGQPTLSVHCQSDDPKALTNIHTICNRFGITHATIQVQGSEGACVTCDGSCNMDTAFSKRLSTSDSS